MVSEDLPAHFNAAPLAGRPMGGTAHLRGSDGRLGDPQDMGVAVIAEQLWNNFVHTVTSYESLSLLSKAKLQFAL